jgi:two-component system chemotaxis response regulator CheB
MTRVMVVDDSPTVLELLVHILGSDPGIEIVGCAADGEEAVRMAKEKKPDVITMDLHMPNMDGFEATRKIMQECPTPIVVVSGSKNTGEVDAGFRAIEAGALMMVQRPFGPGHDNYDETASALIRTVKSMAEVKVVRRWPKDAPQDKLNTSGAGDTRKQARRLVLIGASTGGPAVIAEILAQLPSDFPLPIVIVQHMSPGFADGFVHWLSSAAGFPVRIAAHGDDLAGGRAYLAPDGFHIGVTREMRVVLSLGKPEHGMRPSVSHLFRSIPGSLSVSTVAVLLTGMGKDGAQELRILKDCGAVTVVQDRATSAVYGMPGEAIRQDAAHLILPPQAIGKMLREIGQNVFLDLPFLST